MKTFLRILCMALALSLATASAGFTTTDKAKPSSKSSTKSGSKSKKASSKSKKASGEPSKGKREKSSKTTVTGGFRNFTWGMSLASLAAMDVVESQGEAKYCKLTGDDLLFEGVPMREIVYVFCQGKFSGVLMRYDGELNHLVLQAKLGETMGDPLESEPNPVGDRSWRWSTGSTDVVMEYAAIAATGAVSYFATPLFNSCSQQGE